MKYSTNYFEKGNELLSQKKYAEAIQWYEKDVKNSGQSSRSKVMFNMGIAYNYLGKYKKAVKCYEEVLKGKNYPSPYKALNNMGNSYYRLGQYKKAIECYENALSFENNIAQGNTWFNMGLIYNQLKQYDKAIKCYEKAMEDKHYISLPNIWNELTRAYNKINQIDTKQDALDREVGEALQAEVAILTGGVSVGAHDLGAEALSRLGVEPIFHGVAMRPGKPIFAGRTGKTVVLGLPGNPQSAFTGFLVFAAPLILKLMGSARTQPPLLRARLEEGLAVPRGLTAYFPARLVVEVGRLAARPIRSAGSGDLIALHRANAFVIGEGDRERLGSGEDVPVLPWGDFHLR